MVMVLVGLTFLSYPVLAADPATSDATMPDRPGKVTVEWTGTFTPFVNPIGSCGGPAEATADVHTIELDVPAGLYKNTKLLSLATISVVAPDADVILTVEGPDEDTSDDSDDGSSGADE